MRQATAARRTVRFGQDNGTGPLRPLASPSGCMATGSYGSYLPTVRDPTVRDFPRRTLAESWNGAAWLPLRPRDYLYLARPPGMDPAMSRTSVGTDD